MSGYIYWALQVPSPQANWPTLVADAGKVPSVGTVTQQWTNTFASLQPTLDFFRTQGAHACIDWFTSLSGAPAVNLRNPAIIAGSQDAYLTTWFTACASWGRPLIIFFCSEMNGTWYPAFSDFRTDVGNYSGSFRLMYEHVVGLADSLGCDNITWAISYNYQSPDGSGAATAETTQPYSQFFSTSRPPDLMGIDGFNYAGSRPSFGGFNWMNFDQVFSGVGADTPVTTLGNSWAHLQALDPNIPLCIGSTGTDNKEGKDQNAAWATQAHVNGTQKGQWFTDMLTTWIQSPKYARLKLLRYYSTDHASIGPPISGAEYPNGYSITDNDAAIETPTAAAVGSTIGGIVYTITAPGAQLTAWQAAIASPLYLAGNGFTLPSSGQVVFPYGDPIDTSGDNYTGLQDSVRGLVGHWRLGETNKTAGQIAADRAASNDGTYTGTCVDVVSILPGSTDHALSLDGSSYVTVPDNVQLSPEAVVGHASREVWFQESAAPAATQALIAKGSGGQWEFALQRTTTGFTLAYYTFDGNNHAVVTYAVTPTLNTRHHLVAVYHDNASSTARLYYDGLLVASNTAGQYGATVMTNGTAAFTIGRRAAGDQPVGTVGNPVLVDEVTLRNVPLDIHEIKRLYNAGAQVPVDAFLSEQARVPGRTSHFRLAELDKTAGQPAIDSIGGAVTSGVYGVGVYDTATYGPSAAGLSGTYTGNCVDGPILVPGSFDHSLQVDGAAYVVGVDDNAFSPHVVFGTGTWECWFQEAAVPGASEALLSKMEATNQYEYHLRRTTTGVEMIFYQANAGATVYAGATYNGTITANVPHHLVAVFNAAATNKVALYLDGTQVSQGTTLTGSPTNTTAKFQIARRALNDMPTGSVPNPVLLGHVVVRNTALTAAEVLRLYYAGVKRVTMAMVA